MEAIATIAHRRTTAAGLAALTLITVGCSNGHSAEVSTPQVGLIATSTAAAPAQPGDVKLTGDRGVEVTLTGPIAAKYSSATDAQKQALGIALTGDHNAGTRDSGVIFQQFQNGAIVAVNNQAGTPAYIVVGKIRDAWNVQRDPTGVPSVSGDNGSAGPLGAPTSDETPVSGQLVSTFQHGKIAFNSATGQTVVTVNGKDVPAGV